MPSPATIVIALVLLGIVALVVHYLWKNRKKGGCSCGGNCGGCGGHCTDASHSRQS